MTTLLIIAAGSLIGGLLLAVIQLAADTDAKIADVSREAQR